MDRYNTRGYSRDRYNTIYSRDKYNNKGVL